MRRTACGPMADGTLWASWTMHKETVEQMAASLDLQLDRAVEQEQAMAAKSRLQKEGVLVDEEGGAKMTPEARTEWEASPWAADTDATELEEIHECETTMEHTDSPGGELQATKPRRVASRIYKLLEAQSASKRQKEANPYLAKTMLSAGGRGTGRLWTTTPQQARHIYDDMHSTQQRRRDLVQQELLAKEPLASYAERTLEESAAECSTSTWCMSRHAKLGQQG